MSEYIPFSDQHRPPEKKQPSKEKNVKKWKRRLVGGATAATLALSGTGCAVGSSSEEPKPSSVTISENHIALDTVSPMSYPEPKLLDPVGFGLSQRVPFDKDSPYFTEFNLTELNSLEGVSPGME